MVSLFTDLVLSVNGEAIVGIKPLKTAIKKLIGQSKQDSPYQSQICGSLHKEFAKLCIKAKCYQHSLEIIDTPTVSFKKFTEPMEIVSYLYYKGLIYIGLKRYTDAIEQFRLVLAYPTAITHKA